MPLISPYLHTCNISSGPLQGNEHVQEVHPWDVIYSNTCDVCKQLLVTDKQLLAHIYEQLTKVT